MLQDDAKEAYQRCLDHKFSAKAWLKLLEFYANEGDVHHALQAVVKLTVYHERWYHEMVVSKFKDYKVFISKSNYCL